MGPYPACRSKKRTRGFSLVEILVSLGLLTVVGWGLSEFMSGFNKSKALASDSLELNSTIAVLSKILNTPDACTLAFGGQTVSLSSPARGIRINFPSSAAPLLAEGLEVSSGLLVKQTSIELTSLDAARNVYLGTIDISFERKNTKLGAPPKNRKLLVPLALDTSSPPKILFCALTSNELIPSSFGGMGCPTDQFMTGITAGMQPVCSTIASTPRGGGGGGGGATPPPAPCQSTGNTERCSGYSWGINDVQVNYKLPCPATCENRCSNVAEAVNCTVNRSGRGNVWWNWTCVCR